MGSGKDLTEKEKGKIEVLSSQGCSISEISRQLEQSRFVISNYIQGFSRHFEFFSFNFEIL
jgi:IS30 family transposase